MRTEKSMRVAFINLEQNDYPMNLQRQIVKQTNNKRDEIVKPHVRKRATDVEQITGNRLAMFLSWNEIITLCALLSFSIQRMIEALRVKKIQPINHFSGFVTWLKVVAWSNKQKHNHFLSSGHVRENNWTATFLGRLINKTVVKRN